MKWASPISVIAAVVLLSRCGNVAGPTPGTFTAVYTNTLKSACIECHVPTGSATRDNKCTIDFTSQTTAFNTLTTGLVVGTVSKGTCGTMSLVTALNPSKSYLTGVLFSDYVSQNFGGVTGCTPYPLSVHNQNLSADEKSSMLKWITDGAKNN